MAWKPTGRPTVRQQRDKWVVRMDASGLLASLDAEELDEEEVDRVWSAETERRAVELDAGDADLVTWEHVLQRVDERR